MLINPNNKSNKRILLIIFLLGLLVGIIFLFNNKGKDSNQLSSESINNNLSNSNQTANINADTPEPVSEEVTTPPQTLQLDVPFTSQAPTANWDELHNEACEEASIIMSYAYFNNITSLPPVIVEKEITKLTDWQKKNYGYYLSITTDETVRMAKDVYGLNARTALMTERTIKEALANNKLVVLPANGRLLGNPNFTPPGPIYHMLVITGYNGSEFITNDPGTRRGENYQYSYDTLEQAAGGWDHTAKEVDTSDKRIIIISK
jgi:hypothetical protein